VKKKGTDNGSETENRKKEKNGRRRKGIREEIGLISYRF
jgi:hypothetical protein